jgi:holo-[acyl-carrier protein] synthase
MIIGIGVDIVDLNSFTESFHKSNRFIQRVFTKYEIAYCESKHNKYQHFAARFAAKEAVMKAIGTGWDKGVQWKHIEVLNLENGRPVFRFNGKIKEMMDTNCVNICHISISHSETQAIAFVVLETK